MILGRAVPHPARPRRLGHADLDMHCDHIRSGERRVTTCSPHGQKLLDEASNYVRHWLSSAVPPQRLASRQLQCGDLGAANCSVEKNCTWARLYRGALFPIVVKTRRSALSGRHSTPISPRWQTVPSGREVMPHEPSPQHRNLPAAQSSRLRLRPYH
jgi:hypothetical protein